MYGPAQSRAAAGDHHDFICGETLAVQFEMDDSQDAVAGYEAVQSVTIDDVSVVIALDRELKSDRSGGPAGAGAQV